MHEATRATAPKLGLSPVHPRAGHCRNFDRHSLGDLGWACDYSLVNERYLPNYSVLSSTMSLIFIHPVIAPMGGTTTPRPRITSDR